MKNYKQQIKEYKEEIEKDVRAVEIMMRTI